MKIALLRQNKPFQIVTDTKFSSWQLLWFYPSDFAKTHKIAESQQ